MSNLKDIQKNIQDKEYEKAYNKCQELLNINENKLSLNLLIMNGTCCLYLFKYIEAEKSFKLAIPLDNTGQYIQKIWKNLADIYEKLENWKDHADSLLQLYLITKEKGNYERSIILAESILSSYDKSEQIQQGIQFLTNHIIELGHINPIHTINMISILKQITLKLAQRKPSKIVSTIQQKEISTNIFENNQIFQICIQTLPTILPLDSSNEDLLSQIVINMNCILEQLLVLRAEIFSPTHLNYLSPSNYLQLLNQILKSFSTLSNPNFNECSTSQYFIYQFYTQVILSLIEIWFIDTNMSYESIKSELEQGIYICNWLKKFPQPSSNDSNTITVSQIITFLYSAQIIYYLQNNQLKNCYKLSSICSIEWRNIINLHSASTSSRTTTLNAPSSLAPAISSFQMKSQENLCNTLMMMTCACVGGLVRFCGDSVNSMTVTEILYVTQYSYRAVIELKRSFIHPTLSNSTISTTTITTTPSPPTILLKDIFSQLIPLAKLRALEYVDQLESAFRVAVELDILVSKKNIEEIDNIYDILSKKKKIIPFQEQKKNYNVNMEYINNKIIKNELYYPVSQIILISILISFEFNNEVELIINNYLTNSNKTSISWLTSEKIWNKYIMELKKITPNYYGDDVLLQYNCKRDIIITSSDIINSLETAILTLLSSGDPDIQEIEVELKYRLAVILWSGGLNYRTDKTKCLSHLLSAAKLNPNFGPLYTYLGHYYSIIANDITRAIKCYIKALTYDPMESEAGVTLTLIRVESGDLESTKKLWNDVTTLTASHARWCFGMAGKVYYCLQEYDNAIIAYQKTLELNESDQNSWFGLGLCYSALSQYTAASKSFQVALDLTNSEVLSTLSLISLSSSSSSSSPSSLNSSLLLYITILTNLADVERKLGKLQDCYKHFQYAAEITKYEDIMILKGLGDICLTLAYERYTMGWTSGCSEVIQKGIYAIDALKKQCIKLNIPIPLCAYKLKGDLCCFCRYLGPTDISTSTSLSTSLPLSSLSPITTSITNNNNTTTTTTNNNEIWSYKMILEYLNNGRIEYSLLLDSCRINYELQEQGKYLQSQDLIIDNNMLVSCYYDLGCSYYYQAITILSNLGQGNGILPTSILLDKRINEEGESPKELFILAIKVFIEGLKVSKLPNSNCWNGIGLCIQHDDCLREACFIMATNIEPNVSAYSNLSLLLIHYNLQDTTKECLSQMQLIESNPLHWLSLGTLIERESITKYENLKNWSINIFDAYTASIEVAKPIDALIGIVLAWLRVKGLLHHDNILSTCPNVLDSNRVSIIDIRHQIEIRLIQFLHRRPIHPLAWIILGWSLQYRNSWLKALEAYKQGLLCLNFMLKSYIESLKTSEINHNITILIKFLFHNISICQSMIHLELSTINSNFISNLNLIEIHRCFPEISLTSTNSSILSDILKNNHPYSQIQSLILSYLVESNINEVIKLLLISCRLSKTSIIDKNLYLNIIIMIGELANKGIIELKSNESSQEYKKEINSLKIFQQSSELSEFFLKSIIELNKGSDFGELICHIKNYHLKNPLIQLLIRNKIISSFSPIERFQISSEALKLSSNYLTQSIDIEDFSSIKSFRCHTNLSEENINSNNNNNNNNNNNDNDNTKLKLSCNCDESIVYNGNRIVESYCESVISNTIDRIDCGYRSNLTNRRDLLKAIFYDPSNMLSWASLSNQIYSDNVLGYQNDKNSEKNIESKEEKVEKVEEETINYISGSFVGQEDLNICSKISSFLSLNSSIKFSEISLTLLTHLSTISPSISKNLQSSILSNDLLDKLQIARSNYQNKLYNESIILFNEIISKLNEVKGFLLYNKEYLLQLNYEVGQIYSFYLIQPENAEIYYQKCIQIGSEIGKHLNKSDININETIIYYSILTVISYLRRYKQSKTSDDLNKIKQIIEECLTNNSITITYKSVCLMLRGYLFECQGRDKKAIADYEESILLDPEIKIPFKITFRN